MPRNLPIAKDETPAGQPWALGPTLGLSFLILLLLLSVGTVVSGLYLVSVRWQDPTTDVAALVPTLTTNGLLLSISTLVSGILGTGVICVLIKMCPAMTIKGYLGLQAATGRSLLIWNLLLVLFMLFADRILQVLDQSDPFIESVYQTAQVPGLLFVAVVIVAPIFEELWFRGFMFKGIQASRLGTTGAIVVSAAIWAGIHLQYNAYVMAVIFGLGLLLGTARVRTRSIYVPIAMHGLNNLIAFLVTVMAGG